MLKVGLTSSERWIFIIDDLPSEDPDRFVELLNEYQTKLSGKIESMPTDMQYTIGNDPLKLLFQWDSCFGITVIVPEETDIALAQKTLSELCDVVNPKKQPTNERNAT